ncbi:hypothetical protein [Yinghuangia sp. YIM S09857]|uniref:hypothetical protein n=1 Tax=Yinghuangia sp. YIM S09857 TaxID=3436929 RepID=UPI003F535DBA
MGQQPKKPYWVGEPPAGTPLGPFRKRSRAGVYAQFILQPLYSVAIGALWLVALVASGAGPGGGRSADVETGSMWLSRRKMRLELDGGHEDWEIWTTQTLANAFARSATLRAKKDPDKTGPPPVVTLDPMDRRLLSAEEVARIAEPMGWLLMWTRHEGPDDKLRLVPRAQAAAFRTSPAE